MEILRSHKVDFNCVNRTDLDRQHLANVDLVIAVGGDGTVLSAAHFLDHGTIPLLGINSDPISRDEAQSVTKKTTDERRSHGALCMCTSHDMLHGISRVLYGGGHLSSRTRIQTVVKSTFSETRLVPALNDLLIANPSPAAVSRFRMGWPSPVDLDIPSPLRDGGWTCRETDYQGIQTVSPRTPAETEPDQPLNKHFGNDFRHFGPVAQTSPPKVPVSSYGTVTRFGGETYDVRNSINVWSSGMWVSTSTGSTAAMAAAGGNVMDLNSTDLQYLIREHMIESDSGDDIRKMGHGFVKQQDQLHLRWNSQTGTIFIDGSHMTHNLVLGDEILIDGQAPPLQLFLREAWDVHTDAIGLSSV